MEDKDNRKKKHVRVNNAETQTIPVTYYLHRTTIIVIMMVIII